MLNGRAMASLSETEQEIERELEQRHLALYIEQQRATLRLSAELAARESLKQRLQKNKLQLASPLLDDSLRAALENVRQALQADLMDMGPCAHVEEIEADRAAAESIPRVLQPTAPVDRAAKSALHREIYRGAMADRKNAGLPKVNHAHFATLMNPKWKSRVNITKFLDGSGRDAEADFIRHAIAGGRHLK